MSVKSSTLMLMKNVDSGEQETIQGMKAHTSTSERAELGGGEGQLRFSDRVTIIQHKTLVCSFTDSRAQVLLKPCFQVRA